MAVAVLQSRTDACGGIIKSSAERMESKANGLPSGALRPILTPVANQDDFATALADRRRELGLSLADLDHIAGFHEGYASHLEKPRTRSGKASFKLTGMGEVWLQALGLRLCLAANDNPHIPPEPGAAGMIAITATKATEVKTKNGRWTVAEGETRLVPSYVAAEAVRRFGAVTGHPKCVGEER